MPCRDYCVSEVDAAAKKRLDMLARIACNALTTIEYLNGVFVFEKKGKMAIDVLLLEAGVSQEHVKELIVWWKKHKKDDAAARAKETQERKVNAMIQNAILKLTPEEKKVLEDRGILKVIRDVKVALPARRIERALKKAKKHE